MQERELNYKINTLLDKNKLEYQDTILMLRYCKIGYLKGYINGQQLVKLLKLTKRKTMFKLLKQIVDTSIKYVKISQRAIKEDVRFIKNEIYEEITELMEVI